MLDAEDRETFVLVNLTHDEFETIVEALRIERQRWVTAVEQRLAGMEDMRVQPLHELEDQVRRYDALLVHLVERAESS